MSAVPPAATIPSFSASATTWRSLSVLAGEATQEQERRTLADMTIEGIDDDSNARTGRHFEDRERDAKTGVGDKEKREGGIWERKRNADPPGFYTTSGYLVGGRGDSRSP